MRYGECSVNCFNRILGNDWTITPAGGLTGHAYFAQKGHQRLFLKRNSSPFLAVLSAEGIVPKLVWTKRMENGDVITAQEWLEGRPLQRHEMQDEQVIELLRKIHSSNELLYMLKRLGKTIVTPNDLFQSVLKHPLTNRLIAEEPMISGTLELLEKDLHTIIPETFTVCHGDLHHNNLIKTENEKIYLIDWDNTMITDPAFDLAAVLDPYIPLQTWDNWIQKYGLIHKSEVLKRMNFYLLLTSVSYIAWYEERGELERKLAQVEYLQDIYNRYIKTF